MTNNNSLPTFASISSDALRKAKDAGTWPLARITSLKCTGEDGQPIAHTSFYVEIISNPEAGWVTIGGSDHYMSTEEVQSAKHALWAAVEVYHQHRLAVHEHGLHVFDIDSEKTPEKVCGAIAAWATNPKFVGLVPDEGWISIKMRNVGNGVIRYIPGEQLPDGQQTKYDYEDMLLVGSANFRIFVPPFLNSRKANEDGSISKSWMDVWHEALELGQKESIEASYKGAVKTKQNADAYQRASAIVKNGGIVKDEALVVKGVEDGDEINIAELGPCIVHVYTMFMGTPMHVRNIRWDGSDIAKALVASYKRTGRFSLVELG